MHLLRLCKRLHETYNHFEIPSIYSHLQYNQKAIQRWCQFSNE